MARLGFFTNSKPGHN